MICDFGVYDLDFPVRSSDDNYAIYKIWSGMIKRCYGKDYNGEAYLRFVRTKALEISELIKDENVRKIFISKFSEVIL